MSVPGPNFDFARNTAKLVFSLQVVLGTLLQKMYWLLEHTEKICEVLNFTASIAVPMKFASKLL
jgi:hypothetical protein